MKAGDSLFSTSSPWNPSPSSQSLFLLLLLLLFLSSGCSQINGTQLDNMFGGKTNLIRLSYTITDNLVKRAGPTLISHHPDLPILVTTFVDNNNLEKTSRFGRILQEHIGSRLVQHGYSVREIKLAETLTMEKKSGETMLTRDLKQLDQELQTQAIVVGTVSRTNQKLYISAKMIDPKNRNILATDDFQLYMDDDILGIFGLTRQNDADEPIGEPRRPLLNSIL